MQKKKDEITIRSSADEYLTFVASKVIVQRTLRCGMRTRIFG